MIKVGQRWIYSRGDKYFIVEVTGLPSTGKVVISGFGWEKGITHTSFSFREEITCWKLLSNQEKNNEQV